VAATGDAAPGGGTFSGFNAPDFNGNGEVAFVATTTGGSGGGIFIGSTSTSPAAVALNGDAAPGGGTFSIATARPDVAINDRHDVVFRADLTGGTADSGYYMRRGPSGALVPLARQGQAAPGTTGVFATFMPDLNGLVNGTFQLGADGDVAFFGRFVNGGPLTSGQWHAKPNGTLEKVLVRGDAAPEFSGGVVVTHNPASAWNTCSRYPLSVVVSGGAFTDGIFLYESGSCLASLGSANLWLGQKKGPDAGMEFDLLVEVLKDGAVVGSGQLNSVPGGGSGFGHVILRTIPLSLAGGIAINSGDTLGLRVSARIAAAGQGSGTLRLWFNDMAANSRFGATIADIATDFYLTGTEATPTLSHSAQGAGPRRSVDVTVDSEAGGNPFRLLGTWTLIWP
jgi:hypothetical protein